MSEVTVELEIDAPPQAVFDLANDPARLAEWVTIVRSVNSHDDGPLTLGWKMNETLVLRGVPFEVDWECVELDAPWVSVMEGKGPVRSKARVENRLSETESGGTLYSYKNEFKALSVFFQNNVAAEAKEESQKAMWSTLTSMFGG